MSLATRLGIQINRPPPRGDRPRPAEAANIPERVFAAPAPPAPPPEPAAPERPAPTGPWTAGGPDADALRALRLPALTIGGVLLTAAAVLRAVRRRRR